MQLRWLTPGDSVRACDDSRGPACAV